MILAEYVANRPELFSSLAQQLQSADMLASHRVFIVLFRTLKELSTKRLSSDQRTFQEVCLLYFLHDLKWTHSLLLCGVQMLQFSEQMNSFL